MRLAILTISLSIGVAHAIATAALPARGAEPDATFPPDAVEFFEKSVRPVLAESCLRCHGEKKQSGGLRLDSREAVLEGGENGPAVVPGDPDKSLLVQAVRRTHPDLKMPPKSKLTGPEVETLADWVKRGAPWAHAPVPTADAADQSARGHWAFQPVRAVSPPTLKDGAGRGASPIDAFVLARLDAEGIKPSPRADKRTLIRRAAFDLTGLPPTAAEVAAFEADTSADAFARVVDRLLASPHYGERWGRHWLDVARYADTKGYVFQEERRYPYAYTYRDYVIRSFNEDRPYDQFIREQLAADLLPERERTDPRTLAALGFLTVGRRFLNNQQDIIDDRIDVVSRGMLGLTVACARCHDHKFDPIPSEDYYSLYGVFASSVEPRELPAIADPAPSAQTRDFEQKLQARRKDVDDYLAARRTEIEAEVRANIGLFFLAAFDLEFNPRSPKLNDRATADGLKTARLRWQTERWKSFLNAARGRNDPVFTPWQALAALPAAEFAAKAPEAIQALAGPDSQAKTPSHPLVLAALAASPPATLRAVAERYADLFEEAESESGTTPEHASIRQSLRAEGGPLSVAIEPRSRLLDKAESNKLRNLNRKVDELQATHPGAPARAMVLNDAPQPFNPYVFLRGKQERHGKSVPRRFLKVVSGPDRKPFQKGSGRLELAEAIARADNPLTARVLVNRIWRHHFGQGLVATPSDFGVRSDPPSHPELLDYLAGAFVANGWSIKAMHRLILLSNTYQQRSDTVAESARLDPLNRWLWRSNRRRLEFEPMRDAVLAVAGQLDETVGGRPVPLGEPPFPTRRTVYGFIDRQNLDSIYRTFDFASPDASSPRRFVTTVPQQALFLMNSPFLIEQTKHLAARLENGPSDPEARTHALYRRVLGRSAEPREVALGLAFVAGQAEAAKNPPPPIWRYGFGGFDESSQRVVNFTPFRHWTGTAWQVGPKLPDPLENHVHLTATGGHTGRDAEHAAILRWTAPRDGAIAIDGTLGHAAKDGDGVRGRIVSSRTGPLGTWEAHHNKAATTVPRHEVRRGETIDFAVDLVGNENSDSYTWAPVVRTIEASPAPSYASRDDFQGPPPAPLSPWEEYAQVLLLTNEFLFVD